MKTPALESLFNNLLHKCFPEAILNPLIRGGNKKVTHT